jgi:hypothetical protein
VFCPPQSLVAQPLHHFCPCHWGSPSNQSSGLAPCLLSGICCLFLRTHCSGSLARRLRTASIEAQDARTPYKPVRLQRCATSTSPLPSINLAITSISTLHSSHITSSPHHPHRTITICLVHYHQHRPSSVSQHQRSTQQQHERFTLQPPRLPYRRTAAKRRRRTTPTNRDCFFNPFINGWRRTSTPLRWLRWTKSSWYVNW